MIDIHCHIMPGVDDGSVNLEESLVIFENAATSGITDIVLTPHYIRNTKYHYNNDLKQQLLNILKEGLRRSHLNINLHLGNEVYIDDNLLRLIKKHEISTLANSRYLLLELPVNAECKSAPQIIFELMRHDIIPVIAHPERYVYFQKHPEKVDHYIELGCLMQGNYQSLFGKYSKKAKTTLKTLLKTDRIHLLASDTHHSHDDYRIPEAEKKVLKIIKDSEKVQQLFIENPEKIIKDQDI